MKSGPGKSVADLSMGGGGMFVVFPDGEAAKGWFEGNVWPDGRRPRNQIGGSPPK